VIVITGYADVQMAVRAMRAGAVTFLEKPCGVQQLWSAIRQALHWESELARQHARRAEIESQMAQLTPDELKVFELVVEGRPNKVIASELDIGLRTVELRRASVIKKLHAGSLAELVRKTLIVRGGEDRE
jgi:FixJ family two-component response regulator